MRVVRTQWPVGQGCFASGIIDADGAAPIHYVYDCGARNRAHLGQIVSSYADRVDNLDALFVSHLDADHVDGLDFLLAKLSPKEVYLPYVDIVDQVVAIMEAEAMGRLTASFVQAQLDPAEWFISRGAESVILVRNDGDSPDEGFRWSADGELPRSGPDGPISLKCFGATPSKNYAISQTTASKGRVLEMGVGGSVSAISGVTTKWLLVPFVPAVDVRRLGAFRSRLRKALKLKSADSIPTFAVRDRLKDKTGRQALRNCYDEITNNGAKNNHNKVSMSLYSGPVKMMNVRHLRHFGWDDSYFHQLAIRGMKPGWIGTGDAKLRSKKRRDEWNQFYQHLAPFVGTFLLPHHGSQANWHPDLLNCTASSLFVAAADEQDEGYEHPSLSVVDDICDKGGAIALVTKRHRSRLIEWID